MNAAARLPLPGLQQAIDELRGAFGERLSTAQAVREQHGKDMTWHQGLPPDAVVFVRSTEEVQEAVTICARHAIPTIAYGAGSSLEGHINAPRGGVTVDVSGMDCILELNAEDLDVTVQPGVTREALNTYARRLVEKRHGVKQPLMLRLNASISYPSQQSRSRRRADAGTCRARPRREESAPNALGGAAAHRDATNSNRQPKYNHLRQ